MRYHISDDGEARPCDAPPGKCPIDNGFGHYESEEEAQKAYEDFNYDKLFTDHSLIMNEVDSEFDYDSSSDEMSLAESVVIDDLKYIETRIQEHQENVSNGVPISKLDDWHQVELGAEYEGLEPSALARAWDRQDYDSVRMQYARALSYANNFTGEISMTPDELIMQARHSDT